MSEHLPMTDDELKASIQMVEELRANLMQQTNMTAGSQVLVNTKRLYPKCADCASS